MSNLNLNIQGSSTNLGLSSNTDLGIGTTSTDLGLTQNTNLGLSLNETPVQFSCTQDSQGNSDLDVTELLDQAAQILQQEYLHELAAIIENVNSMYQNGI